MWNVETSANMTPDDSEEAIRTKTLRCDHVYTEYICKGIFVAGLTGSIRSSTRSNRSSNKSSMLHDLARYATLVRTLHGETTFRQDGSSIVRQESRQYSRRNNNGSPVHNVINSPSSAWSFRNSSCGESNDVHVVQLRQPSTIPRTQPTLTNTTSSLNVPCCCM